MNITFPPPLNVAIKLAENSTYKHRLGAVVVKQKKIIGRGWNSIRHHKWSKYYEYPCSCHAETAAILDTGRDNLFGSSLYVSRINTGGDSRLARPCDCCRVLLKLVGIRKVIYTTNDGFAMLRL